MLAERISELKKEKNATIFAHNYQRPEIQDIADVVADSLKLARKAVDVDSDIVVVCGVDFMAETVKLLNPEKKILIPNRDSHCPMAAMLDIAELKAVQASHPDAKTVLYVNTLAEAKALADCVCTSANAPEVINAMDSDEVIFGPDKNLSYYAQKNSNKKIITVPANGICPTHNQIQLSDIISKKQEHPDAHVLVHPECIPEVQGMADHIASTEGMIKYAKKSRIKKFIICTENGHVYRLSREIPEKTFIQVSDYAICPGMKMHTLGNLLKVLESEENEIKIPEEIAVDAKKAIERMLAL